MKRGPRHRLLLAAIALAAGRPGVAETVFRVVDLKDDPQVRQPDITKAKKILGWEPKISLEEGLAKTIDYFRAKLREQKQ